MLIAMPLDLVAEVRCFLGRLLRQLEGKLQDAVHALAGKDRLLDHRLALGAFEHAAADRRVLALGVLAHHVEVDVAHLAVGQRAGHAGHQAHRAQVDVLVEVAPELDQRAPQRDVVGHRGRPADGAEVDGVKALELREPVVRHHLAVLQVVVAVGPVEGRRTRARGRIRPRPPRARAGPSGMTSLPMPSPAMTAMRCFMGCSLAWTMVRAG
jgi:hypothetical protein